MQQGITVDRLAQLRGEPVYDTNGDKIGKVDEIFYDLESREPEWIGIGTGFFGMKRVLVPVDGASASGDGLTVAYDKSVVKDSPDIDGDEISPEAERDLYAYYGIEGREASFTGDASGYEDRAAQAGDVDLDRQSGLPNVDERSLTRSEEELAVGKRQVESGRVRLRKWVETEPVETTVELERETAHVHRERIDQPVAGAEIGEQVVETTLREEQPVVEKQTVARERVSLDKDVDVRQETVRDEVRKERVEVEGAVDDDDPNRYERGR
jgi:stress response protein YsnF